MSRWTIPAAWAFASPRPTCVAISTASSKASGPFSIRSLSVSPLVVGHYQIQLAVARLIDLVDGADVGMVQRGGGLGFLKEPLLSGVVFGQIRREELDGDRALEAGVRGLVDDTHPALAELANDPVRPEGGTRGKGHGRSQYIAGLG